MGLVDTDVMVDILRGYLPAREWLVSLKDEVLLIPGFVAMELVQGCRDQDEQRRMYALLLGRSILWPDAHTCNVAFVFFGSRKLRHGIGMIDALIGQLAVDLALPLNTFNQKHYAAIPDLVTVQPYARS